MAADDAEGDQRSRWAGSAGRAWVRSAPLLEGMFAPLRDLLVGGLDLPPAARVIDVGCGTGDTTLAVAAVAGEGARCLGVDLSEPMVAEARRRAHEGDLADRVRFEVHDAQSYRFDPGKADAVISRFGVMFFADPLAAFANLRAATRPGGALAMLAWRGPDQNPFMVAAERAAAPLLPQMPPRDLAGPGQFGFADDGWVRSILRGAGWADVALEAVDVPCELPRADLERYATQMGQVGPFLAEAAPELRRRVIAAVIAAFDPFIDGERVRFVASCWLLTARAPGAHLG